MMELFLSLIVASFVGTLIWLVLCGIRPITEKVFSQTWHYYTSFVPVFFLLGGSAAVMGLAQYVRSIFPEAGTSLAVSTLSEPLAAALSAVRPGSVISARWIVIQEIVPFVIASWATGAVIYLVFKVTAYAAFKRSVLQQSRIYDTAACPIRVRVSAQATTPMLMGLWRPVIILPDTPLSDKELAMILSHELVHWRRGDILMKQVALIANAVHWFNPAVYSLGKQIHTYSELSCDEKVVQGMDADSRRLYGLTLLSMLEYGVMQSNMACATSLCNSKKNMKRRLLNLMRVKKAKKSVVLLSLAATIALSGMGGLVAYAADARMPSNSTQVRIPTNPNQEAGRNISVLNLSTGEVKSYDKDGNLVPGQAKSIPKEPVDAETQKKIDELWSLIDSYIQRGVPAPQALLDELNELQGIVPFGDK